MKLEDHVEKIRIKVEEAVKNTLVYWIINNCYIKLKMLQLR